MRSVAMLAVVLGCGGECIPKNAVAAASFAAPGAPSSDIRVVHSADELRAAIGNGHVAFRQVLGVAAQQDPEVAEAQARERLEAFVTATNFATTDIAIVRAGGDRASLRGVATHAPATTLYFTGMCSACGGGDPGSYESARASEEAARDGRTELVRVAKGSPVVVQVCSTECGTCPANVP